jgi:hypothetical protein
MYSNHYTIKLLGIHLDTKMTWEAHADHLVKTISKKLFVLRQLRSEVNDKTLVTACHALVHSNITYAILVWGHSTHLKSIRFVLNFSRSNNLNFGSVIMFCK